MGVTRNLAPGQSLAVRAAPFDTAEQSAEVPAGGRFAISGSQLVVAAGSLLNREAAASHNVTVRVTDAVDWTRPVTVLTGQEGGLTAEEVAALVARGAQAVTLGPRILRAETAPVALLGAIAALGQ